MEKWLDMQYHAGNREWLRGQVDRAGYPGQFETLRDPLAVAIPREEIIVEMARCGEDRTLDLVCISVAMVVDTMTRVTGV
jgi:hypothetical protein